MRAIVFINGIIHDYEPIARLLRPDDYLVCADGGARHCLAVGRIPHVIVGDLDSLTAEQVAEFGARGVLIERHEAEKNETDLELAIERAIRDGAHEVVLVGALGGRLDQMVGNLLILAQRKWEASLRLVESDQTARILRGEETLQLDGPFGSIVSAIPLTTQVTGITYTGLKYPLTNHTLPLGSTRGISNELIDSPATIRISSGVLLVVQIAGGKG